jgi:hypothetical protein
VAAAIIPRADWGALPPKKPLTPYKYVVGGVQHWVGGYVDPTLGDYSATVRAIQASQMAPTTQGGQVIDIEYNFLVAPNGQIFEGRGWAHQNAACGATYWNQHGLAVCYLGGTDGHSTTPLTALGRSALDWLWAEATVRFAVFTDIRPHSAVFNTFCPGHELTAYCATWSPPTQTQPQLEEDSMDLWQVTGGNGTVYVVGGDVALRLSKAEFDTYQGSNPKPIRQVTQSMLDRLTVK